MSNTRAKILVVDDDPAICNVTRQTLEAAGFDIICADSGTEGLRLARETLPDLILLDVNMPDLSGFEVCRQIKSDPSLRDIFVVLFSSSQTDSDSQSGGLEGGADGYITRPVTNRELIARVQAMLRIQMAESATRKSLAQWQATFDAVGDAIFLTDADFNILNCNRATSQIFNKPTTEIIGRKCHDVIHCSDAPIMGCPFQVVRENSQRQFFIFEYGERWLEVNMDPMFDSAGTFTGTVHIIKDVTDRKRSEDAQRQSEEKFSTIFNMSPAIIMLADIETMTIVDVNQAYSLKMGYSKEEIINIPGKLGFSASSSQVRAIVQQIKATNRLSGIEITTRTRGGDELINLAFADPVELQGKRLYILTFIDITERKRAEDALRESEALYRNTLDAMLEGCQIIASDWSYRYINDVAEKHNRRPNVELLGRKYMDMWPGIETTHVFAVIRRCMEERLSESLENEFAFPDGRRGWFELRIYPVPDGIVILSVDITERKQAEENLNQLYRRFTLAARAANLGVWDWDIKNNVLVWDDQMYRLYGIRKEDFSGAYEAWLNGLHPDDRAISDEIAFQAQRGEREYDTEFRAVWPDGSIHFLKAYGQVFRDDDGQPLRMIGVNYDITERRHMESALLESEQKYRLITESADEWIYWRTPDNSFLYVSPSCERTTGYTPKEFFDRPQLILEIAHPEDREFFANHLSNVKDDLEYSHLEYRIIRKSGEVRWLSHSCSPLYQDGKFVGRRGTNQDITERKQAEESLRQSEQRFATIFNASPVAIAITQNDSGQLLDVNDAWEELTGYSRSEVIGKMPVELNLWVNPGQRQAMLETAREYGKARIDMQLRRKSSEICDLIMLSEIVELSGKTCVLTMAQDITRRKQAETELLKRASQLALINEVGQKIAGVLAIQGVLDLAARLVNETFGYYHVALFTFDEQESNLIMRARAGQFSNFFPEHHHIPLGEGMVGNTGKSGKMILSNDVQTEWIYRNYFPELIPTAAELSLPIRVGDRLVGVLDVQSPYRNAFNDDDVMVLEILVDQVAVALENARLYEAIWKELIERKKIENELMQHRDHLQEMVTARTAEVQDFYDNAPCGYHSLDANGNFVMINQTELNWLGYTREEMIGRPEMDFLSEQSAAIFPATFPLLKEIGLSRDIELEFVRKDGSLLPILLSATAIYDSAGNFVMSRSTVFDNTERMRAGKSLRESEEQNRLLFEETPEAISLLSMSGEFVRANRAFEQLIKIPLSQVIGKKASELGLITLEGYTQLSSIFARSMIENESFATVEHILLCGDGGQRDVESRIFSLNIGGDDRILVVSREISAQKDTEDALRRANKEMLQAMRLKDEFLASMSHELRTPLTGILGLSEALQLNTYGELNEKQLKALKNIENSGRHLLDLINDILDLSKIEAGKLEMQFEPCSLGDICQASLQMTKGMAHQKRQSVSFSMNPADIVIRADARRVKQMLVNLLSNAVKFTPENGSLGLEVQASDVDRVVRISVWDKGIGIAPEDMKRLFKPFVQLDSSLARQYSGTGLGLSLVHRMAELHGGSIQMDSTLGKGSRFTIILPWSPEGTQPIMLPRRNTGTLRSALTVEDSDVDAEQITRYLRQLNITNVVHPLGKGVVDFAARLNPGVIFLDLRLPDAPGLEILAAIKSDQRTRHIPVVICSVQENRAEAMAQGAAGYLVKPFMLAELRELLIRIAYLQTALPVMVSETLPQGPLVLIADDNQITIEIISDFLGAKHFRVDAATNGMDLLDMAAKIHPDIILMDIQMPGMDGLEATRRVRAHPDPLLSRVPIIALTALAMPGDREMCLQAGANKYMSKPLQLQKLFETIQAMIKEGPNDHSQ